LEDTERVVGSGAGVHDDGLLHFARKPDEAGKDAALNVARRVIVVVVETDLADGDDRRIARERVELGNAGFVTHARVVGMYAGGGRNLLRKTLGRRDRRASGLETPPDADDHESTNPRGASARE